MTTAPAEKVRIGTSGFSYDDWRGVFYPEKIKKGMMLEYYARHFNTLELNSPYYAIPARSVFYRMEQKTPPNFEFIVKCHQDVTHHRKDGRDSLLRLIEAVEPLILTQKMSGFLAQFPFSFKNNEKNRAYLRKVREWSDPLPLFVEFRHESWQEKAIVDFLRTLNAGYVNVDLPLLKGLPRPDCVVTNKVAYLRLHGRNRENWWSGSNETRYAYNYSEAELKEWVGNIQKLLANSQKFYAFFNNHPRGNAVQNANMLKKLIGTN